MTVIGLDDTDSRELGMCTTYVATRLASAIEDAGGHVERTLLVRLNPAVEHKTRGNAALAIHCSVDPEAALDLASDYLEMAATDDDRTNPGVVVADCDPTAVPQAIAGVAQRGVQGYLSRERVRELCAANGFEWETAGNGRGVIGALAAVGAWRAFDEWTYECLSYRERDRWGSQRDVDRESVFAAADAWYPEVWDTVDRDENMAVCIPRTPCPILHGIRGESPEAVRAVADEIESEPIAEQQVFVTNQGSDAHLQPASLGNVENGHAYRVDGTVATQPETREGGHVFCRLADGEHERQLAAFEPTKRFRDRVRALRPGDQITACGEVADGTLKLEKFAVRKLTTTTQSTPSCPACGRTMESAGRDAGYRCRDCETSADGKVTVPIDRELERGWYEVPPCARRHIAKPLVRGGFDAPTHPER